MVTKHDCDRALGRICNFPIDLWGGYDIIELSF
jgi:hypothetical protein